MYGLDINGVNNVTGASFLSGTGNINRVDNSIDIPIGKASQSLSTATMAALENPTRGSFIDYLNRATGLVDFSA